MAAMTEATWDEEVTLFRNTGYTKDELNQQIPIVKEDTVCCYTKPVTRTEFYSAEQNSIQIAEIIVVHPYEYQGEKTVLFNGQKLSVIKTYKLDMEEIELTCVEKLGDR